MRFLIETPPAAPTLCQNCSAPLQGDYCFQCGQPAADFDLPVGEFAKEFASEAFSLDSRLRLTLKPLFFKPGAVPRAYVAGQRARFVPPIRLYIFATFAMLLSMTLGSGVKVTEVRVALGEDAPSVVDSEAQLPESPSEAVGPGERSFKERFDARVASGLQRMDADTELFSSLFMDLFAKSLVFLLPAFAVLLKVAYRRRLYVHHVVFSVYFHAVAFLVVAFARLPDAVGASGLTDLAGVALLGVPPYLLLGMKRFYDESWVKTLAKFVVVSISYAIVGGVAVLALLIVSLLTI